MCRESHRRVASRGIAPTVVLIVCAVLIEPAGAQRGRGFRRLFGISSAQLASHPDVQTELQMNDEQKTRVAEVNDELRDGRRELWGTTFDNLRNVQNQMEELNRVASQKVNDLLEPAQRKRLLEITIQQNGPRSLQDPEVVRELGLSDEQKTKLAEVVAENNKAFESGFGQATREEWRERANLLADEADRRFLGILSSDQKAKLEELKGQAFEADLSQFFFLRGRPDR